jgi:hypothetical protein
MKAFRTRVMQVAMLGLLALAGLATTAQADTGTVRVIFTKGGFIIGVGGGHGVLTFHGHHYPFNVSGASIGATIGASTTHLQGRRLICGGPGTLPALTA